MEKKIFIIALACAGLLASCSGDRTPQKGKDTIHNTYGAKDTSKADTGKITSGDNSASGGVNALKDTAKKDTAKK